MPAVFNLGRLILTNYLQPLNAASFASIKLGKSTLISTHLLNALIPMDVSFGKFIFSSYAHP
jgi:hypothetical protein